MGPAFFFFFFFFLLGCPPNFIAKSPTNKNHTRESRSPPSDRGLWGLERTRFNLLVSRRRVSRASRLPDWVGSSLSHTEIMMNVAVFGLSRNLIAIVVQYGAEPLLCLVEVHALAFAIVSDLFLGNLAPREVLALGVRENQRRHTRRRHHGQCVAES
eukprot:FR738894.1.p2 GENE.FR738894.1~~FR738894.1.p2  ORF type:complete len:157 (-),score=23.61 FR738894.1:448-918(-)